MGCSHSLFKWLLPALAYLESLHLRPEPRQIQQFHFPQAATPQGILLSSLYSFTQEGKPESAIFD